MNSGKYGKRWTWDCEGMVTRLSTITGLTAGLSRLFGKVKPMARRGFMQKAHRERGEYLRILPLRRPYLRDIHNGMNTGMRPGEVKRLRWSYIDRKAGFIRLPAEATKRGATEGHSLNHHVQAVLDGAVRHLEHAFCFLWWHYQGPRASAGRWSKPARRRGYPTDGKQGTGWPCTTSADRETNMRGQVWGMFSATWFGPCMQGMDKPYNQLTDDDLRQAMDTYTAWFDREAQMLTKTVWPRGGCND